MTAPQKAPGAGKIIAALFVMLLLPAIVFGISIAVGASAVSGEASTYNEIGVNQQGTMSLSAGEYSVYQSRAIGAEMTITGPDGTEIRQRDVVGTQTTTVEGKTYSAVADITIASAGDYSVVVEGLTDSSMGDMAIGPQVDELLKKGGIPIAIGAGLAFLISLIGLVWLIVILVKRSRAKKAGGPGGGYPQGQPGYPPQQPGYPGQPGLAPQPGYPGQQPSYPPPQH